MRGDTARSAVTECLPHGTVATRSRDLAAAAEASTHDTYLSTLATHESRLCWKTAVYRGVEAYGPRLSLSVSSDALSWSVMYTLAQAMTHYQ
jgi:hypothetical protein